MLLKDRVSLNLKNFSVENLGRPCATWRPLRPRTGQFDHWPVSSLSAGAAQKGVACRPSRCRMELSRVQAPIRLQRTAGKQFVVVYLTGASQNASVRGCMPAPVAQW